MVHVGGGELVDIAEGVLEGIFTHPYACGQFVTVKIGQCRVVGLVVSVDFLFHCVVRMMWLVKG